MVSVGLGGLCLVDGAVGDEVRTVALFLKSPVEVIQRVCQAEVMHRGGGFWTCSLCSV